METVLDPLRPTVTARQAETPTKSATSWSAIFAGALVAISISIVLFALGSGLGFAAVSPWQDQGVSATTFAVTTAIWFIVVQWLSSAVGGYMAGRLRTRWIGTHAHEVFFRDTAHGFVTWALSTVVVAALVLSAMTGALSGGVHAASAVAAGAAQAQSDSGAGTPGYLYGMDKLFRASSPGTSGSSAPDSADPRVEVTHIVGQALMNGGTVPDTDRAYLAALVAAKTGVPADEAQRRVDDFITTANQAKDQVKAAADRARKAAAKTAIFLALAMVIGAFISSLTAVFGGRLRDEHP